MPATGEPARTLPPLTPWARVQGNRMEIDADGH